jgi:tetratricopeptide (TPR) repeat protein
VGLANIDIGNVLLDQEQYPEALQHFDESYNIFKSVKAEVYMAYAAQSRASALWQLGHSEEAKTALDEATSVAERAEHPEDTYKQLLAEIHLTDSQLELSNWRLDEAKFKSQKALDLATDQYPAVSIQARNALALAQARAGAVRSPKLLCKDAITIAMDSNDPQLLDSTLLSCSETMLDGGETQRALETALRAQQSFARFGKEDSEWRAWSIAAQASKRLGKEGAASEYASYAVNRLLELEQKWGSEAYNTYLIRSDITHFRKQLDQLLKP